MARYTGPKNRLSRRENFDLFGKGTKLRRANIAPGVHGPKGSTRAPSQYGKQLREKQKVKRMYGILERQFKKYIDLAFNDPGNTSDALFSILERRLDNAVYRAGFAQSRPQARQLVSHRHVLVNGKRLNIPSYQLKTDDTFNLDAKALAIPAVKTKIEEEVSLPGWLSRKAIVAKVAKMPKREDVLEAISDQDIIEFYSR